MIYQSAKKSLQELAQVVQKLSAQDFSNPCPALSGATIGEHTRHVLEMFQCLLTQYDSGTINYDQRKRDTTLQTQPNVALHIIDFILEDIEKPNKPLILESTTDDFQTNISTNYHRELMYNLDHCVHHQALIKVAITISNTIEIDPDFGVARSTLAYRKQCAQ
ncbi:MAG: DinB family protein [Flavobacterium sp.]|nr:DinB family protein [Flavobacterium sp.]MBP6100509.1 DinB family protein [Flavobacterium sp.]